MRPFPEIGTGTSILKFYVDEGRQKKEITGNIRQLFSVLFS